MPTLARQAIDMLEAIGEVPRSYSGRGMYGKQCVAVVPKERNEFDLALALMHEARQRDDGDPEEPAETSALRIFQDSKTDAMGRGIVIYWPRLEWPNAKPGTE